MHEAVEGCTSSHDQLGHFEHVIRLELEGCWICHGSMRTELVVLVDLGQYIPPFVQGVLSLLEYRRLSCQLLESTVMRWTH